MVLGTFAEGAQFYVCRGKIYVCRWCPGFYVCSTWISLLFTRVFAASHALPSNKQGSPTIHMEHPMEYMGIHRLVARSAHVSGRTRTWRRPSGARPARRLDPVCVDQRSLVFTGCRERKPCVFLQPQRRFRKQRCSPRKTTIGDPCRGPPPAFGRSCWNFCRAPSSRLEQG